MKHKQTLYESFIIFLKGLLMGCADIVPGISGGTIALITGIYKRLIKAVNHAFDLVNKETFHALFTFRFKKFFKIISTFDFLLFIPMLAGVFTAFLSLSNVIHHLMDQYTAFTYAFFFGLILDSAFLIFFRLDKFTLKSFMLSVIGFVMGFIIVGLDGLQTNHSWYIVILSGAVAITAMILPGISGAFMLVLLGQYEFTINLIRTFDVWLLFLFGIGEILGLLLFSRLLSYLMKKHEGLTFSFLIGLMLGTVRLQYQVVSAEVLDFHIILGVIASSLIGILLVLSLEFIPRYQKYKKNHHKKKQISSSLIKK